MHSTTWRSLYYRPNFGVKFIRPYRPSDQLRIYTTPQFMLCCRYGKQKLARDGGELSDMSDLKLGQLITGEQHRDAIHVAVTPIVASEYLTPAARICVVDGKARLGMRGDAIGIVDPFLEQGVAAGETFWLFLFPGTVTSLRHEWTHPAFPTDAPSPYAPIGDKQESQVWLKFYVSEHCPYWNDEPDGGVANFLGYVVRDREIYYYGSDCHGLNDVEDATNLFRHLSIVLGRHINAEYFKAFTCSC